MCWVKHSASDGPLFALTNHTNANTTANPHATANAILRVDKPSAGFGATGPHSSPSQ